MSKSEGNFFWVRDITNQYSAPVLRFFMLSVHYRSPINFSREIMEASKNGLTRIQTAVSQLKFNLDAAKAAGNHGEMSAEETESYKAFDVLREKYETAMDDDFNTADAISVIFELVKLANISVSAQNSVAYIEKVLKTIVTLCDILGLEAEVKEELLDSDIEQLIEERQAARKNKDFKRADEIRNTLLEKGIVLEDTREGVKWKRA